MLDIIKIVFSGSFYKLRKYAIWRRFIYDYKKYFSNLFRVMSIHSKGFAVHDWEIMGLTNDNYKLYLSTKQYYSIHPLNGIFSKIVDDKMTVKYVFYGTEISKYMPDYYYCTDDHGDIFPLMDAPFKTNKDKVKADVIKLLIEKKKLAIKPIGGSSGKGFCKVEYDNGNIYVNKGVMKEEEFYRFLSTLKNYIISEYLTPHPYLAQFGPDTPNTIRYLVGRVNDEWRMIKSFIRLGTKKSGHIEAFYSGGVLCYINQEGHFHGGYIIKKDNNKDVSVLTDEHPDTKLPLDGDIPLWNEIVSVAERIEGLLPQTKYLGFDFVVTNKNTIKLLEINSLSSLDCIQLDSSLFETENGKWFFTSLNL